ncbi:MAG: FtsQ-type POTRA domain-containing protein [Armatimonadota bacterium]|nr:FtsQ-type POTRA domain-containing protein [Armatimonadota bacterium]MDR5696683.1 FtsQ-type POTRA domain-containing protein [Armatimonadota bacterium]
MRRSASAFDPSDARRDARLSALRAPRTFRTLRFAVAMCFVAAVFSLPASGAFTLREVTVAGNRTLSEAEVIRRSGLRPGRPLRAADAERAAAAVRSIPQVRSAAVHIAWPHRAVVTVTERSPLLALSGSGGVLVLDEGGVPFRRQAHPDGLVPLTVGLPLPWVRLGEPVPHRGVREVAAAFASLDAAQRSRISSMQIDVHGDLVVQTASGVTLRVGEPAELGGRMRLAEEILRALADRGIVARELDLRFGEKVVVRPEP